MEDKYEKVSSDNTFFMTEGKEIAEREDETSAFYSSWKQEEKFGAKANAKIVEQSDVPSAYANEIIEPIKE